MLFANSGRCGNAPSHARVPITGDERLAAKLRESERSLPYEAAPQYPDRLRSHELFLDSRRWFGNLPKAKSVCRQVEPELCRVQPLPKQDPFLPYVSVPDHQGGHPCDLNLMKRRMLRL